MFGGVWIIWALEWALVKMFASHFQNRFQDKSPTVDIKTCLLHSVSVALSKQKKKHGRSVPHDSLNAGMSAMAMLHSVSNCVCYQVGKLPLLGWEVSQNYCPFSRKDSF